MADMRSCIKTGCRWPAAATLSYRYTTSEVWLSDLGDPHPSTHDLCPHHADSLRVPRGWTLVDERQPAPAHHEPSAAEIVERVTTLRQSVDALLTKGLAEGSRDGLADRTTAARRSRYAALLDTLPTYDAPDLDAPDDVDRQGSDQPGQGTADDPAGHADRSDHPASIRLPAGLVGVGVSHEMAPIAREMSTSRSVLAGRHLDRADAAVHDPDAVHETGLRGAVVLCLPLRDAEGDPLRPGAHRGDDRGGDGDGTS